MTSERAHDFSLASVIGHIEALRQECPSGFEVTAADRAAVEACAGAKSATYGEVLPSGMAALAQALGVQGGSVFADLGSGTGLIPLAVAMLHPVAVSLGIELSVARHEIAAANLALLRTRVPASLEKRLEAVRLKQSDLLIADWHAATHLFAAATCFPAALLRSTLERARATPSLQRIAMTVPLPPEWRAAFSEVGHVALPMSFGPRVKVHLYEPR